MPAEPLKDDQLDTAQGGLDVSQHLGLPPGTTQIGVRDEDIDPQFERQVPFQGLSGGSDPEFTPRYVSFEVSVRADPRGPNVTRQT